jgi:hypothetical protein
VALSVQRLAELRALCEAATPGPWERLDLDGAPTPRVGYRIVSGGIERSHIAAEYRNDAALIVAARTALPEALAEIERLREENEVLRECAAECGRDHLSEIERLTDERDRLESALASLGHLPDDAEHTRWCEPCRRVREGGGT